MVCGWANASLMGVCEPSITLDHDGDGRGDGESDIVAGLREALHRLSWISMCACGWMLVWCGAPVA